MTTKQPAERKAIPYQGEVPPPLPLPPLAQTLERYLHAIKAVVSPKRYENTQKIVQKFGEKGGEGEYLQNEIAKMASESDNWVYDFWLNDMYLKNRLALPINSNPGMVFPPNIFKGMDELCKLAAHFVNGILDFKHLLDNQSLPLDKIQKQPLCMAQYYRLLTTCRIPNLIKDYQLSTNGRKNEHITVIYKRKFYIIPVIIEEERVSENVIANALKKLVSTSQQNDEGELVGILTGDQRDKWAKARTILIKDKINQESLESIETSLFVICIDDPLPLSFNQRYDPDLTRKRIRNDVNKAIQMLCGGGSKFNSPNRWFDQTLQLILSPDGTCGLCYEHSPAEGIVVIQLMEQLVRDFLQGPGNKVKDDVQQKRSSIIVNPIKLGWKISAEIDEAINSAIHNLDKLGEDLNFYVLQFREYGKEYPKANKVSPDVFVQLALQLTFFKVHRKLVSTYESASTRRFRLGRVDNIRAATPEALKWVQAMCGDNDITDEDKFSLFKQAIKTQTEIMAYNVNGQGIDCHLLGLKEMAQQLGRPTPEIFTDDSFRISNHFALSTSQVTTQGESFMGYGPVVCNGYGVSYNLQPEKIIFCVSSFFSDDDTSSEMFAMSLESTLLQMSELLEKSKVQQSSVASEKKNGTADGNTT